MGKHESLANRLRDLRRALGWTQQDLSRGSGLTRSYISRLEMGDIALPSSDKLRALAQALGSTPEDLLQAAGYIDKPSTSSELPDVKVYLRRKYGMQDPRILQACETIVQGLARVQGPGEDEATSANSAEPAVAGNGNCSPPVATGRTGPIPKATAGGRGRRRTARRPAEDQSES